METINKIENKLNEVFAKNAPQLPADFKKFIVKIAPVVTLIIGVLTLLSTWSIWSWAHRADQLLDYARQLCNAYDTPGCGGVSSHLSIWIWLSLIFLLVEAVLYIAAFKGLSEHRKQGWNYLYYGALLNVLYAVVSLFTDYDKVGHFLGALVGSAIGFYLLFQIREFYLGTKQPVAAPKVDEPAAKPHDTKE